MIYKFLLVSEEVSNFKIEIKIDADATFLDFHKTIMDSCDYEKVEMTSFIMCDDDWRKKQEITLMEIDTDWDVDSYVMEDEVLSEWFDEEKQKLMFVFDYNKDRFFYIELKEMILGKSLNKPTYKKQGNAPTQFLKEEVEPEIVKPAITSTPFMDTDEEFYGEDNYDLEEIDKEGFEGLDEEEPDDSDLEYPEDIELL